MKKVITKIIEVILTIIVCLSFVLMCGEASDGSVCVTWTLGWMAALVISAKILDKMGVFDREGSR